MVNGFSVGVFDFHLEPLDELRNRLEFLKIPSICARLEIYFLEFFSFQKIIIILILKISLDE